ncbi:hypothetical protein P691DRAFT_806932 [Macrolepiota fuliginosa MF-IS2]|uniref:Uncharacterized protein n=1 Tax=Macrolepiota fuliginosa MF-IS2 TaxID=1400762 RepID=A0A9P5X616_9AGAR|nr:hypothetical protein P691DRAFT_806932 [Macrolepiota fuliginosa MF-IS2]
MPYYNILKEEAMDIANRSDTAEVNLSGLYTGILTTWFPISRGYLIDPKFIAPGKSEYLVVRKTLALGAHPNPLLIVENRHPKKWNDAGKREVLSDLTEDMEGLLDRTQYGAIYGLGAIGVHWMACKMEKGGPHTPTTLLDWDSDISSDESYDAFKTLAELVYNIN